MVLVRDCGCSHRKEIVMDGGTEDIFKTIFAPKSIAVFGASSNPAKSGSRYLKALLDVGYPGRLYPIHPKEKEIFGLTAYACVGDCPGPVDYAMFCVPADLVPDLVEACGLKGVKAVQLFTAGFKESGEPEGALLEEKMVRIARRHGIRIIGPNCIGIYCPESRISYGMSASPMEPGDIAFLSQSGGHASRLIFGGFLQGLRFSKVVSYGNGCDLNAFDFLRFFGADQKTRVIGAYIEGIEDVRPFFDLSRRISREKPVVIWKGGQTEKGKKTLLSHTGSLAGSYRLWDQGMRQSGAVMVREFEEMTDTLLAFSRIPYVRGNRLVLLTGLMGGGGGISVAGTDIAIQEGLDVINLSAEIQARIAGLLPKKAGTILTNPVDTGSAMNLASLKGIIELLLAEGHCDVLVIQEYFDRMADFFGRSKVLSFFMELMAMGEKSKTALPLVWPPEASAPEGISLRLDLIKEGLTVYPTLRRAARAVSNVVEYKTRIEKRV